VRRVFAFVAHNWPLKVAAVGLAALLYVALALSQNSKEWRGQVAIDVRNQPSAVLTNGVQFVTSIRYFAPVDVANRVTGDDFSAWIDLSNADATTTTDVSVDVHLTSPDPEVQIVDWTPKRISVHLDPLREKVVPVQVDEGTKPPGLEVRDPVVDTSQVTVSGTQSTVSQVVAAVAKVRIDPAGLMIDQEVDLVPVDARGETVSQVHLAPSSVRVTILVGSKLQSRALPVNPIVTGTPGTGFELDSVDFSPLLVTVEGDATTITALTKIDTKPLSVSGATADVSQTLGLDLPDGITVIGSSTIQITAHIAVTTGTRTFSVGIVLSGAHDDRTYALSTDQVLVTLGGSAAALAGIQGTTLVVTADVDALGVGGHNVALKATLPAGITLVAINPANVIVTVGAPATPSPAPPSPSPSAAP
jgi:YbbR domain-containing protein